MAKKGSKKKRTALLKRVLIVGGTLIVIQIGLILHFQQSTRPTGIREEIDKQVDKTAGISAQRREQLRIQLAVNDFRIANNRLPTSLDELRPKYFDTVPIDPDTGAAFKYAVEGTKYILGEPSKAQERAGKVTGASLAMDEQTALIATLDVSPASETFVYDPTGKREPFRPFDLSPKIAEDPSKTPLERYDLGQLKLTAVIGGDEPAATVENQAKRGFIVKKGTKIGLNGGEVVEILPDRIKILETQVDFTGQKKTKVTEMMLRSKEFERSRNESIILKTQ